MKPKRTIKITRKNRVIPKGYFRHEDAVLEKVRNEKLK